MIIKFDQDIDSILHDLFLSSLLEQHGKRAMDINMFRGFNTGGTFSRDIKNSKPVTRDSARESGSGVAAIRGTSE